MPGLEIIGLNSAGYLADSREEYYFTVQSHPGWTVDVTDPEGILVTDSYPTHGGPGITGEFFKFRLNTKVSETDTPEYENATLKFTSVDGQFEEMITIQGNYYYLNVIDQPQYVKWNTTSIQLTFTPYPESFSIMSRRDALQTGLTTGLIGIGPHNIETNTTGSPLNGTLDIIHDELNTVIASIPVIGENSARLVVGDTCPPGYTRNMKPQTNNFYYIDHSTLNPLTGIYWTYAEGYNGAWAYRTNINNGRYVSHTFEQPPVGDTIYSICVY
jgi:hypothetical protein